MDRAASSTTLEATTNKATRRGASAQQENPTAGAGDVPPQPHTQELKKALMRKYRHVAALHSQSRPSTLSHDATATPSFLGFRNLGLIVLIAGNLRLLIENIQKYGVLICVRCHDFRRQDLTVGIILYSKCHYYPSLHSI